MMPTFKYYNIQWLPRSEIKRPTRKIKEIGKEGYKRLFSMMKAHTDEFVKNKTLILYAAKLRGDTYFTSRSIAVEDDYAYGTFIKFNKANDIVETLSGDELFRAGPGQSSERHEFFFVFDFSKHILAIESKAGLPSRNPLKDSFEHVFSKAGTHLLQTHTLKIEELTESNSLDEVLKENNSFNKVKATITFSNSEEFADAMSDYIIELEGELKEKNIDERTVIEKSEKDSVMSKPSRNALAMIGLAAKFGNAEISYNTAEESKKRYRMVDFPVKIGVLLEKSRSTSKIGLAKRVFSSIKTANERAEVGQSVLKMLRGK